jgi:hypothetical protein
MRAVRLVEMSGLVRIEAVTEIDFQEGRRWLELLGFECEGRFSQDGALKASRDLGQHLCRWECLTADHGVKDHARELAWRGARP